MRSTNNIPQNLSKNNEHTDSNNKIEKASKQKKV